MAFQVGDRVRVVMPEGADWAQICRKYIGLETTISKVVSPGVYNIKGKPNLRVFDNELEMIGAGQATNKKEAKHMASATTLVQVKLSADDRFAQNEYLENADGSLTGDGKGAFLEYLYQQGDTRTKFIKAVRDAKKKLANDELAYTKSVTADKDDE